MLVKWILLEDSIQLFSGFEIRYDYTANARLFSCDFNITDKQLTSF